MNTQEIKAAIADANAQADKYWATYVKALRGLSLYNPADAMELYSEQCCRIVELQILLESRISHGVLFMP